jgi:hypothetical protein
MLLLASSTGFLFFAGAAMLALEGGPVLVYPVIGALGFFGLALMRMRDEKDEGEKP